MRNTSKESSDRDRLVTRPDEPLPTAQNPQEHENPKDPKPVATEQGTNPKAAEIDYTV
jgi:hypothetical protein